MSGHTLVVDGGLTTGTPENVEPGQGNRFSRRQPLIREGGQRGVTP